MINAFSEELVLTFLLLLAGVTVTRILRSKRGALYMGLCHGDVAIAFLVSSMLTAITFFTQKSIFSDFLLVLLIMLWWLDALLFIQFRVEINRQTIQWFFTGSSSLMRDLGLLLQGLKKYPAAALLPIGLVVYFISQQYDLRLLAFVIITAIWLLIVIDEISSKTLIAGFVLLIGEFVLYSYDYDFLLLLLIALWVALGFVVGKILITSPYFSTPSLMLNLIRDDQFVFDNKPVKNEFSQYIKPDISSADKSDYFGSLKGSNVLLITMESLGSYIQPFEKSGIPSLICDRYYDKSWVSHNHHCITPNTTVSTAQMYSGEYSNNPYNREDSKFDNMQLKHLSSLKNEGIYTEFIDSADTGLYDYYKLLDRIDFDRVTSKHDMNNLSKKADYRIPALVDDLAKRLKSKDQWFVHLINDQTHVPYELVNTKKFSRFKNNSPKSLYLNAVEEVDGIWDDFLRRLESQMDLSNTMIIFTGDHGEAFGEYGYSFHSNSIVPTQTKVPFMLYHPELDFKEINKRTSHFDLFPTIFDLLGIEIDHSFIGNSLALPQNDDFLFLYSATLKGNTPANFGFYKDGSLYWMDRLFNRLFRLSEKSGHRKEMSGAAVDDIKAIMYQMLIERKISA